MFPHPVSLVFLTLLCPAVVAVRTSNAEVAEEMEMKTQAMVSGMLIDGKYTLRRRHAGPVDSDGDIFYSLSSKPFVFSDPDSDVFHSISSEPFDFSAFGSKPGGHVPEGDKFPNIPGMVEKKLMGRGAVGEAWVATDESSHDDVLLKFLVTRSEYSELTEYITTERLEAAHDGDMVTRLVRIAENECGAAQAILAKESLDPEGAKHVCKCRESSLFNKKNPSQPLYLVQDLCGVDSFGGLLSEPEKHPEITSKPHWELVVVQGALQGMALLAKAGFVHHDLKPDNIVVDAEGSAKIIDFGGAISQQQPKKYPTMCTLVFKPPEAECCSAKEGLPLFAEPLTSFDSYSMGITMLAVLCKGWRASDFKHYAEYGRCSTWDPVDERSLKALELAKSLVAKKPGDRPDPSTAAMQLGKILGK